MSDDTATTITGLLLELQNGDSRAADRLFTVVYDLLRDMAHRHRGRWQGDLTLNTTALVHEAYLKLTEKGEPRWESRSHLLTVASKAMRHILVDYASRRKTVKRGGHIKKLSLDDGRTPSGNILTITDKKADQILALHEALERLADVEPREAKVVEYRFFGGLTVAETAGLLGVSTMTVKRDWAMARAWLMREMN